MLKFSDLALLFAACLCWSSAQARPHYNEVQERLMEVLTNEWIEDMKSVPEPYQSWAIEKIKDARSKDWNSIGDYFVELFNISQQVIGKFKSELAISKRDASEESAGPLIDIAINMVVATAEASKRPELRKKIYQGLRMEFDDEDDAMNYFYDAYKEATGIDLSKHA